MNRGRIVFAGGGHAHLYSLKRTADLVGAGYEVVLVNPSRFLYYSGMAPGTLSRIYHPEEARIDVGYLVERGGGRFIKDKVEQIRHKEREVVLGDGDTLRYNVISACLGSRVPSGELTGSEDRIFPVKPVENVESLRYGLLEMKGSRPEVLVVGGGPAGCEVACNMAKVAEDHRIDGRVTIADAGDALLGSAPGRARKEIQGYLRSRGVRVVLGCEVVKTEGGVAHARDGRELAFDVLVLAVGIKPSEVFRESGLATAEDGGMFVNRCLQSVSAPEVFGGGDSIAYRGDPLKRLGVFAIRQGPVIFRNLRAFLEGRPLEAFEPQRVFLYVLTLGNGEGLAVYGPLVWRGRSAWRLKQHVDAGFMKEYRYPEDEPDEARSYLERLSAGSAADLGIGVGGRVPSGEIGRANGEGLLPPTPAGP